MALYHLTIFILIFTSTGLHADLYKWIDENGKVHYSDKITDKNKGAKHKSIDLKKGKTASLNQQMAGKAIIRPYEKTARTLHLLDTVYHWKKNSEVGRSFKLGAYHSGKACTSRGAIKIPDVLIHHNNLLPNEKNLTRHAVQVINGLDYQAIRTQRYELIKKLRQTGGLSLHSEVIELNIQTCAPNARYGKAIFQPEKISSSSFTKNRIKLKVKWQLKSNRDQNLVYTIETRGVYNGWNKHTSANKAIQLAIESALVTLFSDRDFINHILVKEDAINLASETARYSTIRAQKDKPYKKLFLDMSINAWRKKADPGKPVGRMLFGEKCAASKALQLTDVTTKKKISLPRKDQYYKAIINPVKDLGYQMVPIVSGLADLKTNQSSLKLRAELIDLNFDVCAPSLPASSKHKSIDNINSKKLTRKRAKVSIKWVLRTLDGRNIIYQSKTIATVGDLLTDSKGTEILEKAIGEATKKLFSEPYFIDHLMIKQRIATTTADIFVPNEITIAQPIIKPQGETMSHLFVVTDPKPWSELKIGSSVGVYAISNDCLTVKKKSWPQTFNDSPRLFPKKSAISNAQANIIKSLGYQYRLSSQKDVLNMKRKLGGYSLHAKIIKLRYDSCAANIDQPEKLNKKGYKIFNRHRVIVDINWDLYGQNHQQVVYTTTTQGTSNSWLINNEGPKVFLQAIENATEYLFSDQKLVNLLIQNPEDAGETPGLFDKLFSMIGLGSDAKEQDQPERPSALIAKSYVPKAKLAQVLVDLTALKIPMTEYFMIEGEWPNSLEDINLPLNLFEGSKELSYVSIDDSGNIIGELDGSFGPDKMIRLSPQQNQNTFNIRWECSSNISARFLPNPCEHSPY